MDVLIIAVVVIVCAGILIAQQKDEWHVDDREYDDSPLWRTKR